MKNTAPLRGAEPAIPTRPESRAVREHALLARYFAPLRSGPAPLDCHGSILSPTPGYELVFSTGALTRGVHFTPADPPHLIAQKALRVHLAELAATGATPLGYNLHLHLPQHTDPAPFCQAFSQGLRQDQSLFELRPYDIALSQTFQDLVIHVTIFGQVPTGRALPHHKARPGDRVYVSGTIGDAALGLHLLTKKLDCHSSADRSFLENRYLLPQPRTKLGPSLPGVARAAVYISDGFLADLERICKASGVGAYIKWHQIPWSDAFRRTYKSYTPENREKADVLFLTGGDDYELIFTVAPGDDAELTSLAKNLDTPITLIGHLGLPLDPAQPVILTDQRGVHVTYHTTGFQHSWDGTGLDGTGARGLKP